MPEPHNFLSALVGSFAMPAAENPTVAMIEAAFRHHRLDAMPSGQFFRGCERDILRWRKHLARDIGEHDKPAAQRRHYYRPFQRHGRHAEHCGRWRRSS